MKIQSEIFILDLIETTRQNLNYVELLKQKNETELNWKENSESWSVLECLEHLNLYGYFYIPEIEKTIIYSKDIYEVEFKSGILGNYFAESMLPKQRLNKIKTFKDKNPLNNRIDRKVIDEFINQQTKIIDLLNKSKTVSLNKNKVHITLTRWIKLKLGDTFRFIIHHNIRHLNQIQNNIKIQNSIQ
ncbi:MAG: DinB family protein [Flavobacterium sp.]|nr:DinB family protein [Flavobacterium sp.]